MTEKQLKLLSKIKKLIIDRKKRFSQRKDRDIIKELLEIGISESLAWKEILSLSNYNYYPGYKPFYLKNKEDLYLMTHML